MGKYGKSWFGMVLIAENISVFMRKSSIPWGR
jgi:hypothetical protein